LIEAGPPELILLDIACRGWTGLRSSRQLKTREESRGPPVIFLSGIEENGAAGGGIEIGRCGFHLQAFPSDELLARSKTKWKYFDCTPGLNVRRPDLRLANEQLLIEIDERKQAEEALRESEARYRA